MSLLTAPAPSGPLTDVLADEPGLVAQLHVIALLDETTDDEIARLN